MTTLGRNVAANVASAVFVGVVTLGAAPLVLRWLGAEAYGLVAFQTTVQSLLLLFDAGFSVAINRELASLGATPAEAGKVRSVMRTALPFYWAAAVAFCVAMLLAAPLVADRWLADSVLPRGTVVDSLRLMSFALAGQFLAQPYIAGFLGMQRQVLYSGLTIVSVVLRIGGGALVALATGDVRMFFAWQVIAAFVQIAILAVSLRRVLPEGRAEFRPELMRRAWELARGVAVIGVMAAVASQADKLAVSRSASLAVFGYYSMAALLAVTTAGAAAPIASAVFPRFAELLVLNDRHELTLAYHRAVQTMAAIVLPIASVLCVWSREVLFVWTGQPVIASAQGAVTVLLVAGMALNGLLTIPYMLQLAHGWTRPAVLANGVALVTFVPAMFVAAEKWGPFGTAAVFAAMHAAYFATGLIATEKWLLPGSAIRFARDIAPALIASLLVAAAVHLLLPAGAGRVLSASYLFFAGLLAFITAVAVTPAIREWMAQLWRSRSHA